jgi:hypothetical protein
MTRAGVEDHPEFLWSLLAHTYANDSRVRSLMGNNLTLPSDGYRFTAELDQIRLVLCNASQLLR